MVAAQPCSDGTGSGASDVAIITLHKIDNSQLSEATYQPCARLETEAVIKERAASLSLKAVPAAEEMAMMIREKEEDCQV
jgi:hypothetical protein